MKTRTKITLMEGRIRWFPGWDAPDYMYSSHMFAGPGGAMMFRFPAQFKLQEISLSRIWGSG